MPYGTSYGTMKRAIINRLSQRPALQGVNVAYSAPVLASDTKGPAGAYEGIFFGDTPLDDGRDDNVIICSVPLQLDETYTLCLYVQVVLEASDGSQEAADERVDALIYEIAHELAHDPTFGVEDFNYTWATRFRFRRVTGHLPRGPGHGAGAELRIEVKARLTYYDS